MIELVDIAKSALATDAEQRQTYVEQLHAFWMQEANDMVSKWSAAEAEDGTQYFYNAETLESMWENPAEVVLAPYRVKLNAISMLIDDNHVDEFLGQESGGPSTTA